MVKKNNRKNNIFRLQANEKNIKSKIKEIKKDYKKKSKKQNYNSAIKILNSYENNFSFNNENKIKLLALRELVNNLEQDIDDNASYPDIEDLELSYKLYHKKEFHQYRLKPVEIKSNLEGNIDKLSKKMCDFSGKRLLTNTQKLIRNYISPYTPYNGLLVYHGVGVGKTCTAIAIAEGFKEIIKGNKKKIYVLLPRSIQVNFVNEILNKGLIEKSIEEAMRKCTGDSYFKDGKIERAKKSKKKCLKLWIIYYENIINFWVIWNLYQKLKN